MAPIAVDPNALAGAGASVGAVGDGLTAAMSTLTGSFDAKTGQDSAGAVFGQQYSTAAAELLKAVSAGVNAAHNVGYGVQVNAANYSRAEVNSDISGRSQPLSPPPRPAPISVPASPSATGGGVAEPLLRCVVEALIGDLWPNGDPTAMRAAAAAWRAFAVPLHHVSADMSVAYNAIGAQQMDEAELIQKPIRDIGTGFSDVAFGCEQLAGALEQFASDVEQTQRAIRNLLHRLGSIGGIVGTFFELVTGHGEQELHEIAADIKTVLHHLKAEADSKTQLITQGKAAVDKWALQLESWVDREFVDFFGEHVGSALVSDLNMFVDVEEGGFRWLVSTAEGLSALNPVRFAYDTEGARPTWASIAELGSLVIDPAGTYARDPEGVKAILKGLARTDEWSKDRPLVGLTQNVLDLATLAVPGAGEASAAADPASAAGRVARVADVADEAGAVARAGGKFAETSRGAGALADVGKDGAGVAGKFDEIARKPVTAEVAPAGGRPVSLSETAERGVPAVTKDPVRNAPPGEAATAKRPAVERTGAPTDVRAGAAETATVAAGAAGKAPAAAGAQTSLSGVGDAFKPVGSAGSSGAEAASGLVNGLRGVADGVGAGAHGSGPLADVGGGAAVGDHLPVDSPEHRPDATGGAEHDGSGHGVDVGNEHGGAGDGPRLGAADGPLEGRDYGLTPAHAVDLLHDPAQEIARLRDGGIPSEILEGYEPLGGRPIDEFEREFTIPGKDGKPAWDWTNQAPNGGFAGTPNVGDRIPLGHQLDRLGSNGGGFMADEGAPLAARAMPPGVPTGYHHFVGTGRPVPDGLPWEVRYGPAKDAFGQPGGARQWAVIDITWRAVSVDMLIKKRMIVER